MVPATTKPFMMSSPEGQGKDRERPQHDVTIAKPFAVAKFALTFNDPDACAAHGDCAAQVNAGDWGRGRRPVINVSWDDAQLYVKWLSRITGKTYRLLSETEYEYATRAGSATKYPWGEDINLAGKPMANCDGCGGEWAGGRRRRLGSSLRTPSASTTWSATSGNGLKIVGTTTTKGPRPTAPHGRGRLRSPCRPRRILELQSRQPPLGAP